MEIDHVGKGTASLSSKACQSKDVGTIILTRLRWLRPQKRMPEPQKLS